jgi:hypothetical protein
LFIFLFCFKKERPTNFSGPGNPLLSSLRGTMPVAGTQVSLTALLALHCLRVTQVFGLERVLFLASSACCAYAPVFACTGMFV